MRITVRLRIVLGFGLVTLLLLGLGIMSLWSMNTVSQSTQRLLQFSLPTKDAANQLERLLDEQQIAQLTGYHARTSASQQQQVAAVTQLNDELRSVSAQLAQRLIDYPRPEQLISQFQQDYQGYWQQVQQVDRAIGQKLLSETQLQNRFESMELLVDDTSSLLLDIMDLEFSDSADEQSLAAYANGIDTNLNTLFASSLDLADMRSLQQVDTLQGELSYSVSGSETGLQSLIALNQQIAAVDNDDIEALRTGLQQALEHYQGEQGLLATQRRFIPVSYTHLTLPTTSRV